MESGGRLKRKEEEEAQNRRQTAEKEQSEETRAQRTDVQDAMSGLEEERTGVRRTRLLERAKAKATEAKETVEAKGEQEAKECIRS